MENLVTLPNVNFWKGKRVLLTGHTGFKGAWMTLMLQRLGVKVIGIGLPPQTSPSLFDELALEQTIEHHLIDITAGELPLRQVMESARPQIVIHMAAQALVRRSYSEPVYTFNANVMGTVNLLEAARKQDGIEAILVVTTDKVYRNTEDGQPFVETDPLGGHDPYSASKAACEMVVESYSKSFFSEKGVPVISARAGNVIGGGDWSEDRLIPDAIRAWSSRQPLIVRRPNAIRPWQHVVEPLTGYLVALQECTNQSSLGGSYNFGPNDVALATVGAVCNKASICYGNGAVLFSDELDNFHEATTLRLNSEKAKAQFAWSSVFTLEEAIEATVNWYKAHDRGEETAWGLCIKDLDFLLSKEHDN